VLCPFVGQYTSLSFLPIKKNGPKKSPLKSMARKNSLKKVIILTDKLFELAEHFYKKYKQTYQDGYKEPAVKPLESNLSDYQQVDLNSTTMETGKEIGAERLCWHMLERMDIEGFLKTKGWKKQAIDNFEVSYKKDELLKK